MPNAIQALSRGDALLIVDMQRDFLPGGSLAVPDGAAIIPRLNECAQAFAAAGLPVFATRDWHPPDHCSFRAQGGPWPSHCVAGSAGAQFAAELVLPAGIHVVSKGTAPLEEAYSAFQGTGLARQLRALGCRRLFVGGLATDYCVRATAEAALQSGFDVVILEDAVRAVDIHTGDGARALAELRARGARVSRWDGLPK